VKESDNLEDQSWIPVFWVNPELPDLKPGTSGFCLENPNYEHQQNRPWKHDSFARDIIYGLNVSVLPKESNRSIIGKEIGQKE